MDALIDALEQQIAVLEKAPASPAQGVNGFRDRMLAAGEKLQQLAEKLSAPENVDQGKKLVGVGILCPDGSLRQLLEDILHERGYRTHVVNGAPTTEIRMELLVCSIAKVDGIVRQAIQDLGDVPCIWLSQYSQSIPPWATGLNVVEIVEKPFSLEKIFSALERVRPYAHAQPNRINVRVQGKVPCAPKTECDPDIRRVSHQGAV